MVGLAPQLSVAVGEAAAGILAQLTVTSAGTPDKTGSVVSLILMFWVISA